MSRSILSEYPWPSIPGTKEPPKWEGDGFVKNGKKLGSLICYDQTESNWSERITTLHEEENTNGQHPIGVAPRELALRNINKFPDKKSVTHSVE